MAVHALIMLIACLTIAMVIQFVNHLVLTLKLMELTHLDVSVLKMMNANQVTAQVTNALINAQKVLLCQMMDVLVLMEILVVLDIVYLTSVHPSVE